MDTGRIMTETKRAFDKRWSSVALGTFIWSLCILGLIIISVITGTLIMRWVDSGLVQGELIGIGIVLVIMLTANGPFFAGYVKFIVTLIKYKICDYKLLFFGFQHFGTTFLIGFYSWCIMMAGLIACVGFFVLLNLIMPAAVSNVFFRIIVVGISSLLLIILYLRLTWIPFFIFEDDRRHLSSWTIVKTSMRLMYDNEINLFVLFLRFMGWNLLTILTLGIGWYWIFPYIVGSTYFFYTDIRESKDLTIDSKDKSGFFQISLLERFSSWSTEKTFTITFIILFWAFCLGLAFS